MHTDTTAVAPAAPAFDPRLIPAEALHNDARHPDFGKEAAVLYPHFRGYYAITTGERGTFVSGPSPDGRYTGACDRCGIDIRHVYVFENVDRTRTMHVGVDCATRMGVPLDALRAARAHAAEVGKLRASSARNLARAEAAKGFADRVAAIRAHNRAVHEALVADLEGLATDDNATDWEKKRLRTAVELVELHGDCLAPNVVVPDDGQGAPFDHRPDMHRHVSRDVETIRTRLALCRTSRVLDVVAILASVRALCGWSTVRATLKATREGLAAGVKGKAGKGLSAADKDAARGVLTLTLEAWRKPLPLEGGQAFGGRFAQRYRNFFRDDAGNAYTYVGTKVAEQGDRVTATWTADGTDSYAGLTATRLSRPRNAIMARLYDIGDALPPPVDGEGNEVLEGYERVYLAAPAHGPARPWY